ncbi:UbiH/UbiF family hydroxylase [Tardiphaga alba]|uniref:UbiH/UbiF family hydroxylase n=1 Tax=Tardiphaga alba TaxID=340268 RepID=A0ABX8A8R8_9BRAD|nr:UbiH/UbiF family hydroxylase [Tardiphaga alba]QUS40029.1 UbiH/UbiF family hydroxylase [Tardiphaga alba]
MTDTPASLYDVAIVGGGPAGLAAAVAVAETGARTALVARRLPYADNRTTALLGGSVDFLQSLDVWHRCADKAAALTTMRLVDDTNRLIRAPEVKFVSEEIGLDTFGYNIENRELMIALEARAAELSNLVRIDDEAASVNPGEMEVTILTAQGETIAARLAVGADGRQSMSRDAAGITAERRPLDQVAVTFNVSHSRPHRNVSTEFHTPAGPCVFVPLPGDRSSIVWINKPADAERLMALSDDDLSAAIEKQSHYILGRMTVEPGRYRFPLGIGGPRELAKNRVVLVGDAAHVVPPIGAQGLNLGLRDASDLADMVRDAGTAGQDIGAPDVIARYTRMRRSDIASRTFAIDMANRSLLNDLLPVQIIRAAGMHAMGAIGPLRRLAMREGLSPSWRKSAF